MDTPSPASTLIVTVPKRIACPFNQIVTWTDLRRAWGIEVIKRSARERQIRLPPGWRVEETQGRFGQELLLDAQERFRAVIYPGDFPAKPFIALRLRYHLECIRCDQGILQTWYYAVVDTDAMPAETVWEGSPVSTLNPVELLINPELAEWQIQETAVAKIWLDLNLPDWRDPFAYRN